MPRSDAASLRGQVAPVLGTVGRAGVQLGVRRDGDGEVIAAAAHQLDQLECIGEVAGRGAAVGRRIAGQGQDVVHAVAVVVVQQLGQLLLGVADAGQVRHRRMGVLFVERDDQVTGAVPGGTAGAVGDRHERQVQRVERLDGALQELLARLGLGREVLDAQRRPAALVQLIDDAGHGVERTGGPVRGSALRRLERVHQQEGPGHGAHAADPRRQPARHLAHLVGDVADDLAVDDLHARRDHRRPGRTMSAVISPGEPAAATTMSAVRV